MRKGELLFEEWQRDARWKGILRPYTGDDVIRLRGSLRVEYTLARLGAEKLWNLLHAEHHVKALGAITGNQAVEMVQAGLRAIYLSGWQVAADGNVARQMYPDQSLYPVNSVPLKVEEINNAFQRADQIQSSSGVGSMDYFVPIVADAEAGFGGHLNAFELMKAMVKSGAAAVHFEDQLGSQKKCGHMGGKVLISTREAIGNLVAARLAADIMDAPTIIVARTDVDSAKLLNNDIDPRDHTFLTGERTPEGYFRVKDGVDAAIVRGLAYAPYADVLWMETSNPNLEQARRFADAIHAHFPNKLLAYNCSPSFNWKKHLDDDTIAKFQDTIGDMGYRFQFVTLAGFHALNHSMFKLAQQYAKRGMAAYVELQEKEFRSESDGYSASRHQQYVGAGYFDDVQKVISGGSSSTTALEGSTERDQFHQK